MYHIPLNSVNYKTIIIQVKEKSWFVKPWNKKHLVKKKKEPSWKMASLGGKSQEKIVKGRRYLTR